jgi:predicted component of viral defense system (DUF524 family)
VEDIALDGCTGVLRLTPYADDQIREGGRYAYRFLGLGAAIRTLEPRELFRPRPDDPEAGDFVPSDCVGTVVVECVLGDGSVGRASIPVEPSKLEVETEYRYMLGQIADQAAEAILQGYAPAARTVAAAPHGDARLAYRTLAFIAARLRDESFQAALTRIRRRPHQRWVDVQERRPLRRGAPAARHLGRQAQRPSRRSADAGGDASPHLGRLPASLDTYRGESTYDTPPNRFVRHALLHWQSIAIEVLAAAPSSTDLGPGPRGRADEEARWVAATCEVILADVPLRDAGKLHAFPSGDQTLLRRPGYREVLRAFALAETSMALDMDLPDDVFSATQRNVAALYEYWCFLVLARAVSSIGGGPDCAPLFEPSPEGMRLVLKQGEPSRLSWQLDVDGRAIDADLWFNRTFSVRSDVAADATWSQPLRPDASLRLRPVSGRPSGAGDPSLDVWVHFDAKYRVDRLAPEEPPRRAEGGPATRVVNRDDMLKMHAYRDAIRRTAGAYVLYPGDGPTDIRREFHELLPGLGAFPLRPGPDGQAVGAEVIEQFLRDVGRHIANQASARERTQYWSAVYNERPGRSVSPVPFLTRPPADTLTLLGYAQRRHLDWIRRTNQYNLRVGDRPGAVSLEDEMLGAELIVVWTGRPDVRRVVGVFQRTGSWHVAKAAELAAQGYPSSDPNGRYLVTPLRPLPASATSSLRPDALTTTVVPSYSPTATTWDRLSG